jgi:hypothetical protein
MGKLFFTIFLILAFFFKQFHDSKTYTVKLNPQLEFDKKELSKIISETWDVKN